MIQFKSQEMTTDGVDFEAYVSVDSNLQTTGALTTKQLTDAATNQVAAFKPTPTEPANGKASSDEDDASVPPRVPTIREAQEAAQTLRLFLQSSQGDTMATLLDLTNLENTLSKVMAPKQTKVSDFFCRVQPAL
jgi:hypothetical protein